MDKSRILELMRAGVNDPYKHSLYYKGGLFGGDSEAPDYTPVAQASKEAAEISAQLGREQLAESKRQYDKNMEVAAPVVAAQLGLMNQQVVQGDDYYNYGKQYSRPTEQSLYYEAMGFTPEEIQQIEDSRSREVSAWQQIQGQRQQARIPTSFDIPTYTQQEDIPAGAVKGSALNGMIQVANPNAQAGNDIIARASRYQSVKPDADSYYIKQKDGTYQQVAAKTKLVEGTKSITVNAPDAASGDYQIQQTPETDALIAKLTAQASERLKAQDAAERQGITDLNTNLATRTGETDRQVYDRYKDDIDAETGQAVADARTGQASAQNQAIRQGIRYGMNADAIAEAAQRNATTGASMQAAAANGTRKAATQTMYGRGVAEAGQLVSGAQAGRSMKQQDESLRTAKKLDVAGLYRNMPGASASAYSTSIQAGNSAVGNQMQPSQQLLSANQGAASTIMNGQQQKLSGLTSVMNTQAGVYNSNSGSTDALLGALGQVGGAYLMSSDENVKKDVKSASSEAALKGITKLPIKKWKYDEDKIEGMDDAEHTGAMAQDAKKYLGSNVSNGRQIDVISALGVTMAGIKELAKKVEKLEGEKA